jgi:hypothetical protein
MKIKDLPTNQPLDGIKIKQGYIVSAWQKGFWVTDNFTDYKSGKNTQVKPVFFKDWNEAKEFEIKP